MQTLWLLGGTLFASISLIIDASFHQMEMDAKLQRDELLDRITMTMVGSCAAVQHYICTMDVLACSILEWGVHGAFCLACQICQAGLYRAAAAAMGAHAWVLDQCASVHAGAGSYSCHPAVCKRQPAAGHSHWVFSCG